MLRAKRPCIEMGCYRLADRNARCEECQRAVDRTRNRVRPWYTDPRYRRARAELLAGAEVCHLCGLGYLPNDPFTVDHAPAASTVKDWTQCKLLVAHRSCNSRAGDHRHRG